MVAHAWKQFPGPWHNSAQPKESRQTDRKRRKGRELLLMKRLFNILACRDICKSEFAEAERQRVAQSRTGRTLLLDQDESNNSNNISSSGSGSMTPFNATGKDKRCLKLVLQPINQPDLPDLITAFEFAGPLSLPMSNYCGNAVEALEGKQLEITAGTLDISRGVLLLYPEQCRIFSDTGANASASASASASNEIVINNDTDDVGFEVNDSFFAEEINL